MKFSKTFDVNYYSNRRFEGRKWSHKYSETWTTHGDLFCPNCGKKEVWVEEGGGDYYVGNQYICTACAHEFHMPGLSTIHANDETNRQRLANLLGLEAETGAEHGT
jgi:hypothetical protein